MDSTSGLVYNWNRWYSPEIGRYVSPDSLDPALDEPSPSAYVYGKDNPLFWTDFDGMAAGKSGLSESDKSALEAARSSAIARAKNCPCCSQEAKDDMAYILSNASFKYVAKSGNACAFVKSSNQQFRWPIEIWVTDLGLNGRCYKGNMGCLLMHEAQHYMFPRPKHKDIEAMETCAGCPPR